MRIAIAAVAVIAYAGVHGFAASLGAGTGGMGAGDAIVTACGTGLSLAYSTTPYGGGVAVDGIDLSNVPAGCLDKHLSVSFYDGRHDPLGSAVRATLPQDGTTASIPVSPSSNTIDAALIGGVAVVVS